MRLPCAGLAAVATLLALGAAPAAATPVSGIIERVGGNVVRVTLTNTGSSDDIAVAVNFHPPVTVVTASRVSGPAGNCAPSGTEANRVECLLEPPGLAPGQSIVIEILTNPRVEDYAGANAYSCGIPCNTSMMSGPYTITGPVPALRYDLRLVATHEVLNPELKTSIISVDLQKGVQGRPGTFVLAVVEHPPESPRERSSAPTTTRTSIDPALTFTNKFADFDVFSRGGVCSLECAIPELRPDTVGAVYGTMTTPQAVAAVNRRWPYQVTLDCKQGEGETDCGNNNLTNTLVFRLAGDSSIGDFREFARVLTGQAEGTEPTSDGSQASAAAVARRDRPARVEVAVLRLGRGQRGFSGSIDPEQPAAGGKRSCSWLASRGGRFRKLAIGTRRTCDTPLWLRAKGTSRWTFTLRKRLPRGRYVVYSRVVTRARAVETSFTARDGNRRELRVR